MLQNSEVFSSFAVDNLAKARAFYEQTLGLSVTGASSEAGGKGTNDLLRLGLGGGMSILIYAKPNHTPASFTILNFAVPDINQAVDELAARGVTFERYEGMSFDEKGIHGGDVHPVSPVAWFKDPAGNILSVVQKTPGS
jgi:catechol 2,3-dioxygenase-like lactoylglutathione lyase family enzyme